MSGRSIHSSMEKKDAPPAPLGVKERVIRIAGKQFGMG